MYRPALERLLTRLPALEQLQTAWGPADSSSWSEDADSEGADSEEEDDDFVSQHEARLIHSQWFSDCGPQWLHRYDPANFRAAAALAELAELAG